MNWSVWGPPLVVLTAGLIAGFIMVMRSRGTIRTDLTIDAWAKKDSLVDQLRALRADKDKLDLHEWQTRWIILLDEAAAALRDAERVPTHPPPAEPVQNRSEGGTKRLLWVAVVTVFFVGLGAALQTATQQREKGGIMTGGAIVGGTPIEQRIEALKEQASADPTAIDPRNELAHIAIQQGDMSSAMQWMDAARGIDPSHPEVRTNLAILQVSIGMTGRAKTELDAVLETNPGSSKALLWRGVIALRDGDRDTAVTKLEAALENASTKEERMMATSALSEARKPPPTTHLQGEITLAEGIQAPTEGVLFVMVRRSKQAAGPPVAALRLSPSGIPGQFTVTDRDLMMGGSWPDQVWVSARVDTDGNPTTKQASDLITETMGPFSSGKDDIQLRLDGSAVSTVSQISPARVSGTIELSTEARIAPTHTVFVIVRRSSSPAGPPLAAVKLNAAEVPGPFSLGDSDIMMGGPWPENVWIQVRTDADGNAITKDDDALSTELIGPIKNGATNVVLPLSR